MVRIHEARSPEMGCGNITGSGKASEEGTFELDLEGCIGVLQRDKRRKGSLGRGTTCAQV